MNQSFSDQTATWRRTSYVVVITKPLKEYEEIRSWMGFTLGYGERCLPGTYQLNVRFRIEEPDPLGHHRVYVEGKRDVLPGLKWLKHHFEDSTMGKVQILKLNQPK